MTRLIFRLDMPNNNSWNGKWSGEGCNYYIKRQVTDKIADELLKQRSWYYNFGDGWGALVSVSEAPKGRLKKSDGFCGYDWMVSSIMSFGEILNSNQQAERYREMAGIS